MSTTNLPASEPAFRVKFYGGALHGQTRDYPREQATIKIMGWQYEPGAVRDGDHWVYVPIPRCRMDRRILRFVMAQTQKDPRLKIRTEPMRVVKRGRNERCYCGSGLKYKRCHGA